MRPVQGPGNLCMSTGLRARSEVHLAKSGRWSASEDGKTREKTRSGAPGCACACCPQDAERNLEDAMHVPSAREASSRAGYAVIVACEITHVDATGSWQQGGHRRNNRRTAGLACTQHVRGRSQVDGRRRSNGVLYAHRQGARWVSTRRTGVPSGRFPGSESQRKQLPDGPASAAHINAHVGVPRRTTQHQP